MTTKAQELETLGKIRELLGTLDADGWVNMAFKGVCDIAENNIRDDFGNSPVERVEELEKQLAELRENFASTKTSEETWKADTARLDKELKEYKKDFAETYAEKVEYSELLNQICIRFKEELEEANKLILEHCAESDSELFKNAVKSRQYAKFWFEKVDKVIS